MGCTDSKEALVPHMPADLLNGVSVMFKADEIRKIWSKFYLLWHESDRRTKPNDPEARLLPAQVVLNLPELQHNPFKYRIVRYFSKSAKRSENLVPQFPPEKDRSSAMQLIQFSKDRDVTSRLYLEFDDFIQLFSAFSTRAPLDTKSAAAFGIYDFNEDRVIDVTDIQCVIMTSLGESFSETDTFNIAREIMQEADVDGNRQLDVLEFARILKRIPEFMANFQIDLQL